MPNQKKTKARRPGRPRNDGLRATILNAARRLFLTHGAAVSVDAIAREAHTTKVTLYSHFASKEELLNAMLIEQITNSFSLAVEQLDPSEPRAALLTLAHRYLDLVLGHEVIENISVLIAMPKIDHGVHSSFFEFGPYALAKALGQYLARVPHFEISEPENAAEQFLAMVRGNEQIRVLLGLPLGRAAAKSGAYVESCVDAFVRGYARDVGAKI